MNNINWIKVGYLPISFGNEKPKEPKDNGNYLLDLIEDQPDSFNLSNSKEGEESFYKNQTNGITEEKENKKGFNKNQTNSLLDKIENDESFYKNQTNGIIEDKENKKGFNKNQTNSLLDKIENEESFYTKKTDDLLKSNKEESYDILDLILNDVDNTKNNKLKKNQNESNNKTENHVRENKYKKAIILAVSTISGVLGAILLGTGCYKFGKKSVKMPKVDLGNKDKLLSVVNYYNNVAKSMAQKGYNYISSLADNIVPEQHKDFIDKTKKGIYNLKKGYKISLENGENGSKNIVIKQGEEIKETLTSAKEDIINKYFNKDGVLKNDKFGAMYKDLLKEDSKKFLLQSQNINENIFSMLANEITELINKFEKNKL